MRRRGSLPSFEGIEVRCRGRRAGRIRSREFLVGRPGIGIGHHARIVRKGHHSARQPRRRAVLRFGAQTLKFGLAKGAGWIHEASANSAAYTCMAGDGVDESYLELFALFQKFQALDFRLCFTHPHGHTDIRPDGRQDKRKVPDQRDTRRARTCKRLLAVSSASTLVDAGTSGEPSPRLASDTDSGVGGCRDPTSAGAYGCSLRLGQPWSRTGGCRRRQGVA